MKKERAVVMAEERQRTPTAPPSANMANEEEPHIAVLVLDTPIPGLASKHGDFGDCTINLLKGPADPPYQLKKYYLKPLLPPSSTNTVTNTERDDEDEGKCKAEAEAEAKGDGYGDGDGDDAKTLEKEELAALEPTYTALLSAIHNHRIRGFILTGSASDAFGTYPWLTKFRSFLKNSILRLPWPVVGICFGHQVIAQALGCKVDRSNQGWELGITTIELNDEIYKLSNTPFLELSREEDVEVKQEDGNSQLIEEGTRRERILYQHLNLVEFHRDIVYGGLPSGFINIGSTSKCSIQGMISTNNGGDVYAGNADSNAQKSLMIGGTTGAPIATTIGAVQRNCPILTFQGHPEFTSDFSLDLLQYKYEKLGVLTEKEYEKAKYHTSTLNNQGDLIGKVICKFLFQENQENQ